MSKPKTNWYVCPSNLEPGISPETFSIALKCGNDAFRPYWNIELARILKDLSELLMEGDSIPNLLKDYNGNTIGSVIIK